MQINCCPSPFWFKSNVPLATLKQYCATLSPETYKTLQAITHTDHEALPPLKKDLCKRLGVPDTDINIDLLPVIEKSEPDLLTPLTLVPLVDFVDLGTAETARYNWDEIGIQVSPQTREPIKHPKIDESALAKV